MTGVLTKRDGYTGRMPREKRYRNWSGASTTKKHQDGRSSPKAGRGMEQILPEAPQKEPAPLTP
mgnify:CR=1 FL=1